VEHCQLKYLGRKSLIWSSRLFTPPLGDIKVLSTPPTMQPTLPTSRGTPPQIQDAMQELSLLQSSLIEHKEAGDTA
jgi:hypothetical protein